ncbi:hypothetical protein NDU88_008489 [Pleurodeles waltl]|uniref:Uncharacterized protein n=1 Tax=Pleurodeles waltl TaxID=8319 RepID=A0AAV7NW71_PLEWA|nr:hypothetical protein NDU88_008489 [Pleurodeles waltl]
MSFQYVCQDDYTSAIVNLETTRNKWHNVWVKARLDTLCKTCALKQEVEGSEKKHSACARYLSIARESVRLLHTHAAHPKTGKNKDTQVLRKQQLRRCAEPLRVPKSKAAKDASNSPG